jgi:hypothetical protein
VRTLLVASGALAVLAALTALVLVAVRALAPGPTDEDRIRALFREGATALSERRVGDAMEAVSPRFRGGDLERAELHRYLAGLVLRGGGWLTVKVAVEELAVAGDRAEARLVAAAAQGGEGAPLDRFLPADGTAVRIRCTLAREERAWRVDSAEWRQVGLDEALEALGAAAAGAP